MASATHRAPASGAAAAEGSPLPLADARRRVAEYEAFLRERLQPDLAAAVRALEAAAAERADFASLGAQLAGMAALEEARPLKLRLALGAGFYAHAAVPDPSFVCVHVGLGFFAELSAPEAAAFAAARQEALGARVGELGAKAATIRAHVQVLLDAIAQLSGQRLSAGR